MEWPLLLGTEVDWSYVTRPQDGTAGREHPWPRGKVLGGTSCLNGMVWMRGAPWDYDAWVEHGCVGWDWQAVTAAYRAFEDFPDGRPGVPRDRRAVEGPDRRRRQPAHDRASSRRVSSGAMPRPATSTAPMPRASACISSMPSTESARARRWRSCIRSRAGESHRRHRGDRPRARRRPEREPGRSGRLRAGREPAPGARRRGGDRRGGRRRLPEAVDVVGHRARRGPRAPRHHGAREPSGCRAEPARPPGRDRHLRGDPARCRPGATRTARRGSTARASRGRRTTTCSSPSCTSRSSPRASPAGRTASRSSAGS